MSLCCNNRLRAKRVLRVNAQPRATTIPTTDSTDQPHPRSGQLVEFPTAAPFSPRTRLVYKNLQLRKLRPPKKKNYKVERVQIIRFARQKYNKQFERVLIPTLSPQNPRPQ